MNSKRKLKQLGIGILLMSISLIGLHTKVQAANHEFYKGDIKVDGTHHLNPFVDEGYNLTCIQKGGSLKPTLTKATKGAYSSGSKVNEKAWCENEGEAPSKPWDGSFTTANYNRTNAINQKANQDAVYIIAEATEKNILLSTELRDAMWSTPLNTGSAQTPNELGNVAAAYKRFYQKVNGSFEGQVTLTSSNAKVGVNYSDKTYTVGPFYVEYIVSDYDSTQYDTKWSWISKVSAIVDGGTGVDVEVLNSEGKRCEDTDNKGNKLNVPKNKETFYIRFKSEEGASNVKIKLDFTYLESCSADTMNKVTGQYKTWTWNQVNDGTHKHTITVNEYCTDTSCSQYGTTHTHEKSKEVDCQEYSHELQTQNGGKIQDLLEYKKGSKKYDSSVSVTSGVVDLTMKLSGYVFLDHDSGKVNEGDNLVDFNATGENKELLDGVEVTLCDENGNAVNATVNLTHVHTGSSEIGGGCYTIPVYHTHSGSKNKYGACYTKASHTHEGNTENGGTCFTTPVYHNHIYTCYTLICTNTDASHNHTRSCYGGALTCTKTEETLEGYALSCNKVITYTKTCEKDTTTIDYYKTNCTKSSDGVISVTSRYITKDNGKYEFINLNAMKKYYIQFTYNGMLYTNVLRSEGNADNISKATEEGQNHTTNRQNFNNQFAEIGSYPNNYKIRNKVFGNSLGEYNKTYLQEEIAGIFKQLSQKVVENNGDLKAACKAIAGNDLELMRKVQFAADCRIDAYSTQKYPLTNTFTPDSEEHTLAGTKFDKVYGGDYDQLHINLGIKARPTVDLALYKDVLKAEVMINGKTETYEYDARTDGDVFGIGITEGDYITALRQAYINTDLSATNIESTTKVFKYNSTTNSFVNSYRTRGIESDSYQLDMRAEEIANGNSEAYGGIPDTEDKTGVSYEEEEINKYKINDAYENLKNTELQIGENTVKNDDRLKIYVTYKLAIRNQSNTVSAVTEVVDYYDPNYIIHDAYIGDEKGARQGEVEWTDTSKYGTNTQYKAIAQESGVVAYKTVYLRPQSETRLGNAENQYIYLVLELVGNENDAGNLLINSGVLDGGKLEVLNLAEINGYKTYNAKDSNDTPGLVDIDSNPGNLNISNISALTQNAILEYPNIVDMYEDDTSRAPAYIYSKLVSRTISGTVFEDSTGKDSKVHTGDERKGNGKYDDGETGIEGVIVQLVEIKNTDADETKEMIVRAQTTTNENGWYGFKGFLPGDYTIRYIYGSYDATAMAKDSVIKGDNAKSYNGQDYQATAFNVSKNVNINSPASYDVDESLQGIYKTNNDNGVKNGEQEIQLALQQQIKKYQESTYYWYVDSAIAGDSDAYDDEARKQQVIDYSKSEYTTKINNHKAEVFEAYVNPQEKNVSGKISETDRSLVDELERRTYRYAYTPEIEIEVEKAKEKVGGNAGQSAYEHAITGVDFGIVERPKSELVIDQDVASVKLTASDGTILVDTANKIEDTVKWTKGTNAKYKLYGNKIDSYDKNEQISIDVDEELLSGAKLEITYNITVTNNGEVDGDSTTRAKTIVNYVSNNLNFDLADNNELWEVVSKDSIQKDSKATLVNKELVDLSTQTTILKATNNNPLTKALKPGQSESTTLTLKKTLSAESSSTGDDWRYSNMSEIVEIDNTVGRYDHGAIPGNQSLEQQPQEHDTSGASRYDDNKLNKDYPPDGEVIITPPTGSTYIYYTLGIVAAVILAGGIFLIKKFVIDRK